MFNALPTKTKFVRLSFTTLSLLLLALVAGLASMTNAQDSISTASSTEVSFSTTSTPALPNTTGQRIITISAVINDRLTVAIDQIDSLANRVSLYIEESSTTDQDISIIRSRLSGVTGTLNKARNTLETLNNDMNTLANSPKPTGVWQQIKPRYKVIREQIINARDDLRSVVISLQ